MSINRAVTLPDLELVPLNEHEKIVFRNDRVQFLVESGTGYPGTSINYQVEVGSLYLTNFRIVYVANPPLSIFKTFQCILVNITSSKITEPVLSFVYSPYIQIVFNPEDGGGLYKPAALTFTFLNGGISSFTDSMKREQKKLGKMEYCI
jgi:hypothetical protein